jgi:hypothetical protein
MSRVCALNNKTLVLSITICRRFVEIKDRTLEESRKRMIRNKDPEGRNRFRQCCMIWPWPLCSRPVWFDLDLCVPGRHVWFDLDLCVPGLYDLTLTLYVPCRAVWFDLDLCVLGRPVWFHLDLCFRLCCMIWPWPVCFKPACMIWPYLVWFRPSSIIWLWHWPWPMCSRPRDY